VLKKENFTIQLIISKLFLDLTYFLFISKVYYLEYVNDFATIHFIISFILLIFFSNFLKIKNKFISDWFKVYFFHLLFLPALTMFTFQSIETIFFIKWVILYFLLSCAFSIEFNFKNTTIFPIDIDSRYLTFFLLAGFIPYYLVFGFNFNMDTLNIFSPDLYGGRAQYKNVYFELGYLTYFFSNFQNVLIAFLLAISLYKKNILFIIVSFFFYLYIFLTTTFKSIFLAPIGIIASYFIIFKKSIYLPKFFINVFPFLILFCIVIDSFLSWPFLNAFIVRRVFFATVYISEQYFTFFESNGFTFFSELPLFNFLFSSPVNYNIPTTIGHYFYGTGNLNVNFLADSYIKLGFLSSLIFIVIVRLLIAFVDKQYKITTQFIIFSLIFIPFFSLGNSSLTTTLFTHGLFISLLIISQLKLDEK